MKHAIFLAEHYTDTNNMWWWQVPFLILSNPGLGCSNWCKTVHFRRSWGSCLFCLPALQGKYSGKNSNKSTAPVLLWRLYFSSVPGFLCFHRGLFSPLSALALSLCLYISVYIFNCPGWKDKSLAIWQFGFSCWLRCSGSLVYNNGIQRWWNKVDSVILLCHCRSISTVDAWSD